MGPLRQTLIRTYEAADSLNRENILRLVEGERPHRLCDLGCDDGRWTVTLGSHLNGVSMVGVEIVASQARCARERGVDVVVADLGAQLPFGDGSFDMVHANQVIEHVSDVDHFLAEIRRILKIGGMLILSTENGSSWHNLWAGVMGWQIFSLTNVSAVSSGLGNPLALHRKESGTASSWTHKTIFNYLGLKEVVEVHGFSVIRLLGAGYHPLPARAGLLDPRHAHFLAIKAVKT